MKKIIFLGDSITDANHNWGVDEFGLGDGYVSMIAQKLNENGRCVKILNKGHDGFTIQAVRRMLVRDCLLLAPDVVSILVGCNDVGIAMNMGKSLKEQGFEENYEELVMEIQEETDAEIICMSPFIFPYPMEYENWISEIRNAEMAIKDIAKKHSLQYIYLQDYLQEHAEECGYGKLTTDGIHLTRKGAKLVAERWLELYQQL
ncbi:MAG: SGNH/GDSL hydrolase family protein [Dorea sp.]